MMFNKYKWAALPVLALSIGMGGTALADNQYYSVTTPVAISGAETYTLVLTAGEGWMFDITDNMDVTSWLIKEDGTPAFAETEGIATTKLVYGAVEGEEEEVAVACEINIDASKISTFTEKGTYDLYVYPTGKETIWVCGENHGQYVDSMEKAGQVVRPEVTVEGIFEGTVIPNEMTQDTVKLVLALDGEIDDSLIDDSEVTITLGEGDGYYPYLFEADLGTLSGEWENGTLDYSYNSLDGTFSEQGGDGNGHYNFNIIVSGLKYNGLSLSDATIHTDLYRGGRTFEITGGSLILDSEPSWASEEEIPVLCDVYPDIVTATWPVGFDASNVTADDVAVSLVSDRGDVLELDPATDFVVESSAIRTTITLNYIYWAYAPVYTGLKVDINTAATTWDEQMYAPAETFTHTFDIASVYVYSVLGGGGERLELTYYGLDGLTDTHQVFDAATYTLSTTDEEGNMLFYGEDENGNGILVESEADAVSYNCDEECNVHFEGMTLYYDRLNGQTEEKTVDGNPITFDKRYYNPESLPRAVDELIDVTVARGYAIGEGWEDHLKWPWQSFIGTGFQGGSK